MELHGLNWPERPPFYETPRRFAKSSEVECQRLLARIRPSGPTLNREAAARKAADQAKVMLAVPLTDEGGFRLAGVLYLDSTDESAFGVDEPAVKALGEELLAAYRTNLAESLKELVESVTRRSPRLSLEEQ